MLEPHIKEVPARVWTLVADEACGNCNGNCHSEDHRESTGELRIRRIQ